MTFNHGGVCTRDPHTLAACNAADTCPADGEPVEHEGMCTRCDREARHALVKAPVPVTRSSAAMR